MDGPAPALPQSPVPRALGLASMLMSTLLMFLFIWLLGFVLNEINDMEGPPYQPVLERHVDAGLRSRQGQLTEQLAGLDGAVSRQQQVQQDLLRSMDNAQQTLQQMMELHRLALSQGVPPTEADKQTLAESQRRFLLAQESYEAANAAIAAANEERFGLGQELSQVRARLATLEEPARREHQGLLQTHRFRVASFKLAFIVPLFLAAAWSVSRHRRSPYRVVLLAALGASFWKLGRVMFDHFPLPARVLQVHRHRGSHRHRAGLPGVAAPQGVPTGPQPAHRALPRGLPRPRLPSLCPSQRPGAAALRGVDPPGAAAPDRRGVGAGVRGRGQVALHLPGLRDPAVRRLRALRCLAPHAPAVLRELR